MDQPDRRRLLALGTAFALAAAGGTACGGGGGDAGGSAPPPPAPPPPPSGPPTATLLGATLASPWGLAFLPDGRMLVTQRAGSMVIVSADGASVVATVSGVPAVNSGGQGGLLDVQLDPDFATDPWVYFTFSEDGTGGSGTALARGRLAGNTLQNVSVLWRQTPKVSGGNHYGSRIAFRPDGTLYVTAGDRAQDDPAAPGTQWAQNVARTQGKVVRLNRDGSVPTDNPSFGIGALPGLWSRGHRNPQGAAVRPGTSDLWLTEHGPQGGDEVNRVLAGRNYGWPLVSYGCPYGSPVGDACRVGGGTHAPTYEEPKSIWVPTSIAPGGIAFYTGAGFPEWQGHLFVTALAGQTLWRLVVDANDNVTLREEVAAAKALNRRIRHVRQGPDGWLYLLTDDGRIVRLAR
jgi:glucose/arabinose dehydrogenase